MSGRDTDNLIHKTDWIELKSIDKEPIRPTNLTSEVNEWNNTVTEALNGGNKINEGDIFDKNLHVIDHPDHGVFTPFGGTQPNIIIMGYADVIDMIDAFHENIVFKKQANGLFGYEWIIVGHKNISHTKLVMENDSEYQSEIDRFKNQSHDTDQFFGVALISSDNIPDENSVDLFNGECINFSCKECEDELPSLYISVINDSDEISYKYNAKQLGCNSQSGFQGEEDSPFFNAKTIYTANSAIDTPSFSSNPMIKEIYFMDSTMNKVNNDNIVCKDIN